VQQMIRTQRQPQRRQQAQSQRCPHEQGACVPASV
jgi:hypothetical protein